MPICRDGTRAGWYGDGAAVRNASTRRARDRKIPVATRYALAQSAPPPLWRPPKNAQKTSES